MQTRLAVSLVACVVMSFVSLPLQADLITNGSFETPLVPVGGFTNFGSGSTLITGWTVVGPQASIVSTNYTAGCCTFPAQDGNQWLDLTGDLSNSLEGVEQSIATTAGNEYTVTFWVGNVDDPTGIFGTTSTVQFLVDGSLFDTVTNSTNRTTLSWEQFTETFKASGSTTLIEFLNADPRGDNSNGLDNVSVVEEGGTGGPPAVPEPASLSLLGIAIAGLGLFRRRKAA